MNICTLCRIHKARVGPERRQTKYKQLPKPGFEYEEMMNLFRQQYMPLKQEDKNEQDGSNSPSEEDISDNELNKPLIH